ncbi:hypothetical protein D3OALGA1CA_804 [Olavius algarvensis associated proteobacterium Delta 3]|nr:hypothetical protein D3OALGA1CA_804 [Olavius algarvensis associated proteobacterium Delta 3]CAB5142437.1 hypothetical protein D3OALGB2SA_4308 [Olavius algarvensis associated proteobacterium Delta 3]
MNFTNFSNYDTASKGGIQRNPVLFLRGRAGSGRRVHP